MNERVKCVFIHQASREGLSDGKQVYGKGFDNLFH